MTQLSYLLQVSGISFLALLLLLPMGYQSNAIASSISVSQNGTSSEIKHSSCKQLVPFGVSNGIIKSRELSSSSVYNPYDSLKPPRIWGASQARLKTASCWCGGSNATWKEDWVQVDLGKRAEVTGLAIQGDPLHPPNDIEEFYVQISDNGFIFYNQTSVYDIHGHNVMHVSHSRDSDEIRYFLFSNVLITRFIRFRAAKLLLIGHNAKFCLRFEIFGCPFYQNQDLYPVGLENGILPDSRITASSSHIGEPPYHARLNKRNSWCTGFSQNQWLQLDLGLLLAVTAITTQGHYGRNSNNMVSSYSLSYSNSTNSFSFHQNGNNTKVFSGNNGTAQDPVMNFLQNPMTARYLRIHPLSGGPSNKGGPLPTEYCIRAEVYARHPECFLDLTSMKSTSFSTVSSNSKEKLTQHYDVFSKQSWCSHVTSVPKVFQINLGDLRVVSGFVISGSPDSNSWITGYNVRFGLDSTNMQTVMSFKGTIGRTDLSVNWLKKIKIAKFLKIEPTTYVGHRCFRVRVLGCQAVPKKEPAPQIFNTKTSQNFAEFKVIQAFNISAGADNITIVLKYTCINITNTSSCTQQSNETVIIQQPAGSSVNLTGLSTGTTYQVTAQVLYSESISYEAYMEFTTSEPAVIAPQKHFETSTIPSATPRRTVTLVYTATPHIGSLAIPPVLSESSTNLILSSINSKTESTVISKTPESFKIYPSTGHLSITDSFLDSSLQIPASTILFASYSSNTNKKPSSLTLITDEAPATNMKPSVVVSRFSLTRKARPTSNDTSALAVMTFNSANSKIKQSIFSHVINTTISDSFSSALVTANIQLNISSAASASTPTLFSQSVTPTFPVNIYRAATSAKSNSYSVSRNTGFASTVVKEQSKYNVSLRSSTSNIKALQFSTSKVKGNSLVNSGTQNDDFPTVEEQINTFSSPLSQKSVNTLSTTLLKFFPSKYGTTRSGTEASQIASSYHVDIPHGVSAKTSKTGKLQDIDSTNPLSTTSSFMPSEQILQTKATERLSTVGKLQVKSFSASDNTLNAPVLFTLSLLSTSMINTETRTPNNVLRTVPSKFLQPDTPTSQSTKAPEITELSKSPNISIAASSSGLVKNTQSQNILMPTTSLIKSPAPISKITATVGSSGFNKTKLLGSLPFASSAPRVRNTYYQQVSSSGISSDTNNFSVNTQAHKSQTSFPKHSLIYTASIPVVDSSPIVAPSKELTGHFPSESEHFLSESTSKGSFQLQSIQSLTLYQTSSITTERTESIARVAHSKVVSLEQTLDQTSLSLKHNAATSSETPKKSLAVATRSVLQKPSVDSENSSITPLLLPSSSPTQYNITESTSFHSTAITASSYSDSSVQLKINTTQRHVSGTISAPTTVSLPSSLRVSYTPCWVTYYTYRPVADIKAFTNQSKTTNKTFISSSSSSNKHLAPTSTSYDISLRPISVSKAPDLVSPGFRVIYHRSTSIASPVITSTPSVRTANLLSTKSYTSYFHSKHSSTFSSLILPSTSYLTSSFRTSSLKSSILSSSLPTSFSFSTSSHALFFPVSSLTSSFPISLPTSSFLAFSTLPTPLASSLPTSSLTDSLPASSSSLSFPTSFLASYLTISLTSSFSTSPLTSSLLLSYSLPTPSMSPSFPTSSLAFNLITISLSPSSYTSSLTSSLLLSSQRSTPSLASSFPTSPLSSSLPGPPLTSSFIASSRTSSLRFSSLPKATPSSFLANQANLDEFVVIPLPSGSGGGNVINRKRRELPLNIFLSSPSAIFQPGSQSNQNTQVENALKENTASNIFASSSSTVAGSTQLLTSSIGLCVVSINPEPSHSNGIELSTIQGSFIARLNSKAPSQYFYSSNKLVQTSKLTDGVTPSIRRSSEKANETPLLSSFSSKYHAEMASHSNTRHTSIDNISSDSGNQFTTRKITLNFANTLLAQSSHFSLKSSPLEHISKESLSLPSAASVDIISRKLTTVKTHILNPSGSVSFLNLKNSSFSFSGQRDQSHVQISHLSTLNIVSFNLKSLSDTALTEASSFSESPSATENVSAAVKSSQHTEIVLLSKSPESTAEHSLINQSSPTSYSGYTTSLEPTIPEGLSLSGPVSMNKVKASYSLSYTGSASSTISRFSSELPNTFHSSEPSLKRSISTSIMLNTSAINRSFIEPTFKGFSFNYSSTKHPLLTSKSALSSLSIETTMPTPFSGYKSSVSEDTPVITIESNYSEDSSWVSSVSLSTVERANMSSVTAGKRMMSSNAAPETNMSSRTARGTGIRSYNTAGGILWSSSNIVIETETSSLAAATRSVLQTPSIDLESSSISPLLLPASSPSQHNITESPGFHSTTITASDVVKRISVSLHTTGGISLGPDDIPTRTNLGSSNIIMRTSNVITDKSMSSQTGGEVSLGPNDLALGTSVSQNTAVGIVSSKTKTLLGLIPMSTSLSSASLNTTIKALPFSESIAEPTSVVTGSSNAYVLSNNTTKTLYFANVSAIIKPTFSGRLTSKSFTSFASNAHLTASTSFLEGFSKTPLTTNATASSANSSLQDNLLTTPSIRMTLSSGYFSTDRITSKRFGTSFYVKSAPNSTLYASDYLLTIKSSYATTSPSLDTPIEQSLLKSYNITSPSIYTTLSSANVSQKHFIPETFTTKFTTPAFSNNILSSLENSLKSSVATSLIDIAPSANASFIYSLSKRPNETTRIIKSVLSSTMATVTSKSKSVVGNLVIESIIGNPSFGVVSSFDMPHSVKRFTSDSTQRIGITFARQSKAVIATDSYEHTPMPTKSRDSYMYQVSKSQHGSLFSRHMSSKRYTAITSISYDTSSSAKYSKTDTMPPSFFSSFSQSAGESRVKTSVYRSLITTTSSINLSTNTQESLIKVPRDTSFSSLSSVHILPTGSASTLVKRAPGTTQLTSKAPSQHFYSSNKLVRKSELTDGVTSSIRSSSEKATKTPLLSSFSSKYRTEMVSHSNAQHTSIDNIRSSSRSQLTSRKISLNFANTLLAHSSHFSLKSSPLEHISKESHRFSKAVPTAAVKSLQPTTKFIPVHPPTKATALKATPITTLRSTPTVTALHQTPTIITLQPIAIGLAYVPLKVSLSKDISSLSYKSSLESKIADTYNRLKFEKTAAVAHATVKVTFLSRRGLTEFVDVVFYVTENSVVVASQKTVDILNQMTVDALTQRLGDVVLGPFAVYGTTTIRTTTVHYPNGQQLLGMVLTDNVANNISAGNNRALFEQRMSDFYRVENAVKGTVSAKIYFLVHEKEKVVYLEFYILINQVIQDSSTVEVFYQTKTASALSAVVSFAVIARPYALSNIRSTDENHVKMTFNIVGVNLDVTSVTFKNSLALKITSLYREARDLIPVKRAKRRRRAIGSVTTYVVSSTPGNSKQAKVVFFILDKGEVLLAATVVTYLEKVSLKAMSSILGVEVASAPSPVTAIIPVVKSSASLLWVIGVVLGGVSLILLILACLYFRWRSGGPRSKSKLAQVESPNKKYSKKAINNRAEHTVRFAEDKSFGGPFMEMRNFAAPPARPRDDNINTEMMPSRRKKIGYHSRFDNVQNKRRTANNYESEESTSESRTGDSSYSESKSIVHPRKKRAIPLKNAAFFAKTSNKKREAASSHGTSLEERRTRFTIVTEDNEAQSESQTEREKDLPEVETQSHKVSEDELIEEENLYESINHPTAAGQFPQFHKSTDVKVSPNLPSPQHKRRHKSNACYAGLADLGTLPQLPKSKKQVKIPISKDIEQTLKEKAEIERSRNKLRQKGMAFSRNVNIKNDKQTDKEIEGIDTIGLKLNNSSSSESSKRKFRNLRGNMFRKNHKIYIADKDIEEKRQPVKLNNYIKVESPSQSINVDNSTRQKEVDVGEVTLNDARQKLDLLLDDAFSLLQKFEPAKNKLEDKKEPYYDQPMSLVSDTFAFNQTENVESRLERPPPLHDGASEARSTYYNRVINDLDLRDGQPNTLAASKPVVLLDGKQSLKYFAPLPTIPQLYTLSPASFAYPLNQPLDESHIYLTPVQPDSNSNLQTTSQIENDNEKSIASYSPPQRHQLSADQEPIETQPSGAEMRNYPQSLIRYIKKELSRLSGYNKGRTKVERLEEI